MRTSSGTRGVEKIVWRGLMGIFPLLAICLLLFSACATGQKGKLKQISKRPVIQKIERERAPETGAKKEIIRTEPRPFAVSATPKARASAKMVEDGRRLLVSGDVQGASLAFQEAINVDPKNGIAYYYLAKAKFELGEHVQASGVLDKAEELLQGSKEWMEAISILREMIKI